MAKHEGQVHPIGVYLKIWALLFVLSLFSYLVDYFHVESYLRWTLILIFMFMKAGLIVAVFMHMRWERLALTYAILLPPVLIMGPFEKSVTTSANKTPPVDWFNSPGTSFVI